MKAGDMVSFEFEPKIPAYGTIVWIEGETAHVDYKNPITCEHQVKPKQLTELTKIGNQIKK